MRICMLAPELLSAWGGVGTYISELVRHLPKDIEVHIITPERKSFDKKERSPNYDLSEYFGSNVHIHYVCKASDTFFYNIAFQYACLKYIPKLVKNEQIDLIHSHTAHMPDLMLTFWKLKPIVTTVHTTIKVQRLGTKASGRNLYDLDRSEKATHIMYPALRLAEEIYFRRKRFYITPSIWMKKWLQNNFHINENVRVIPNSVDMDDYGSEKCKAIVEGLIPQEFEYRKMVLYAGRLLAMKGVWTFIEAIPKILKKNEDVFFVIAGPGDYSRYLDRLKAMKVDSSCFFSGALPRHMIRRLMKAAELVVVPSFHENIPYVVLEAMACGTPVVASNVGGIPEIITDNYDGMLVEPGSSNALANAIVALLADKSLRGLISQRARETIINRFSWKANLAKYLNSYSEALN